MKSTLFAFAAILVAAAPALAQDNAAVPLRLDGDMLVLKAQQQDLRMPLPAWVDKAPASIEALADSTTSRFVDDGTLGRLELYPRGEGEAFWTSLYGARITRQAKPVLADFRALVVDVYSRDCDPAVTGFFQLEADQGDVLPPLGFVCGAYLGTTPETKGKGEVMVVGFYKSDDAVAMVYREWRGNAFNPTDLGSWPVAAADVQAEIERLKTLPALTRLD